MYACNDHVTNTGTYVCVFFFLFHGNHRPHRALITVVAMEMDVRTCVWFVVIVAPFLCIAACSCVHDCSRNAVVGRRADRFFIFPLSLFFSMFSFLFFQRTFVVSSLFFFFSFSFGRRGLEGSA